MPMDIHEHILKYSSFENYFYGVEVTISHRTVPIPDIFVLLNTEPTATNWLTISV